MQIAIKLSIIILWLCNGRRSLTIAKRVFTLKRGPLVSRPSRPIAVQKQDGHEKNGVINTKIPTNV